MLDYNSEMWEAIRKVAKATPKPVIRVNPISARVMQVKQREADNAKPKSMVKVRITSKGMVHGFYDQIKHEV